jgi:hypothetical protein
MKHLLPAGQIVWQRLDGISRSLFLPLIAEKVQVSDTTMMSMVEMAGPKKSVTPSYKSNL